MKWFVYSFIFIALSGCLSNSSDQMIQLIGSWKETNHQCHTRLTFKNDRTFKIQMANAAASGKYEFTKSDDEYLLEMNITYSNGLRGCENYHPYMLGEFPSFKASFTDSGQLILGGSVFERAIKP